MKPLLSSLTGKAPVPYSPRVPTLSLLTAGGRSNPTSQLESMGSVGALFAIVSSLSQATSAVEWRLYRKPRTGSAADRIEVTRHAALDLWRAPNPFYPQQLFIETFQQHIDLAGEAWWVVSRDPRSPIPLELWPVRPDRMDVVPDPDNYIAGYLYNSPDGQRIPLAVDEVIQLRMPNPTNPYRGMGPVQAITTDVESSRYSAEYNRNFFLNGAEPGGIIELPNMLGDNEFDTLRTRWNEQHRGVANAHRVALLEMGHWVDRKYSMRDMEFAELSRLSTDKILQAYRFPKFMLGEVTDVNRATAGAALAMYAQNLIVPRLERIRDALNFVLLPMFNATDLEFDYLDPTPPDAEAEDRSRTSRVNAAVALIGVGGEPAATLAAMELPAIPWSEPGPALAPPVEDEPAPLATASSVRPRLRNDLGDAIDEDALDEQLAAVHLEWESTLNRLVAGWDEITARQRNDLAAQIEAAIDREDLPALAALTTSSAEGADLLADAMIALAALAAARMAREATNQGVPDAEPTEPDPGGLSTVAAATAALLATGLAATAGREALRLAGPETSGAQVAAGVREHLAGLSDRALRDQLGGALMEAQNNARFATLKNLPTATYYASERNDTNTCQPCRAMDGRRFADLPAALAAYPSGGYYACEGGVRCRGTVVAIWPRE